MFKNLKYFTFILLTFNFINKAAQESEKERQHREAQNWVRLYKIFIDPSKPNNQRMFAKHALQQMLDAKTPKEDADEKRGKLILPPEKFKD